MPNTRSAPSADRPPTPDAKTATALKLYVVLMRAAAAIRQRVEASIARHGLTAAEFGVLEALYHRGPMLLGEVQKRILVSSGGITFLVDRLVKKGLVERRECDSDRRARYAALTRDGERLIAEIFPTHAAVIAEAVSGLSQAEQKTATALIRQMGIAAAELAEPVS